MLFGPHPELSEQEAVITKAIYWAVEELRKKSVAKEAKGEHVRTWTREELEELCELAKSNPDQFL
jgi:hypothetical protein